MTDHCGATKKQGEGKCTRPAGWGTEHVGWGRCKLHGGSTPNHNLAAIRTAAAVQLANLNAPPVTDPLSELSRLAGQVVAWRDQMAAKVNELTDIRYDGRGVSGEQLRAEVALFERAMDRCQQVLVNMAKLDLDARLVKISEAQAELVDRALTAALQDAGLGEEVQETARAAMSRHLRSVA